MIKEAVLHIPNSQDAYGLPGSRVVIRFRSARNDMKSVSLWYVDKYLFPRSGKYHQVEMSRTAHCSLFDYYEAEVDFHFISMQYFFLLKTAAGEELYYGKDRFQEEVPSNIGRMYNFPVLAESVLLQVPEWAERAVAYQIFPERFHNAAGIAVSRKLDDWYGDVHNRSFLGGNLPGILEKLEYLEDLGINLIYLNPVFTSDSNHKYDTRDYFEVDPDFGTKDDLKRLIDAAHSRNIRVIFDGVFNHTGKDFFAFQDVLEKGEESEYVNWFTIDSLPIDPKVEYGPDLQYKSFGYYHRMPKLNHANPAVADYICKVGRYWIEEFGIDGWRMDVADEVPFDLWRRFRTEMHEVKSDILLLAEIWYDSRPWLNGDQFDSVMNYLFFDSVIDFIAKGKISASEFGDRLGHIRGIYKKPVFNILWNLIDSHDTPRFLHRAGEDLNKLKLAALVQFTFPGIPSIYYGDEIGMSGGQDPDCRRGMRWDLLEERSDLRNYYKRLVSLRRESEILQKGDFIHAFSDDNAGIYAYRRRLGQEEYLIILNNGEHTYSFHNDRQMHELISDTHIGTDVAVPASQGVILKTR